MAASRSMDLIGLGNRVYRAGEEDTIYQLLEGYPFYSLRMFEFMTTKQFGMQFMMTMYLMVLGKPVPVLAPILLIVYLVSPSLFEPGGALAAASDLLSQFAYVIYFGIVVYFIPLSEVRPYQNRLAYTDFLLLWLYSIFIYFFGFHYLLFSAVPIVLEYFMGYIYNCSKCTEKN